LYLSNKGEGDFVVSDKGEGDFLWIYYYTYRRRIFCGSTKPYYYTKEEKSERGADHRARRLIPPYPSFMYYLKVGAFCFGM